MAFVGVEFSEDNGLAVVSSKWVTPRKKEVFWPPYKSQNLYEKAVKRGEAPDDNSWPLYSISRCFFETDDYTSAVKKIKRAEITSDLQSEADEGCSQAKRIRKPPRKLFEDSGSDEDIPLSSIPRPPRIRNIPKELEKSPSPLPEVSQNLYDSGIPSSRSVKSPTASYTSSRKPGEGDFLKQILSCMVYLKEQNSQIIKLLQNNQNPVSSTYFQLPEDLPVNFPLKDASDVLKIEQYLTKKENLTAVYSYFSTLGGRDTTSKTNTILKNLMSNTLAAEFSFLGTRNGKKAFSELNLKTVIVRAVQSMSPNTLENEINDNIKTWLKHAPQRAKKDGTHNPKVQ